MSKKIKAKAVIFDFDNTLVDTHGAINSAYEVIVRKLVEEFKLPDERLREEIRRAEKEVIYDVPPEKRVYERKAVLRRLSENLSLGIEETQLMEFGELFYKFVAEEIRYPEYTGEVLETLKKKGKKLGLLTATDVRPGLKKRRLDLLGFTGLFDSVVIAGETIPQKKNNPIPFLELARMLCEKPEDTVVVGDSMDADIENAKEAGMKAILIDKYVEPNGGKHEPDTVIHDIKELLEIIE